MNSNLKELLETVVSKDFCIGCGVCASLENSPLKMQLDKKGKYKPVLLSSKEDTSHDYLAVCPFSENSNNETELGRKFYGNLEDINHNEYTGFYLKNYAGYVREGSFREKGSSGGMGNWIATQLLERGLVDGIIHVKSSETKNNSLFEYQISYNKDELFKGAKSKYYPIELSQVINLIRENNGRYALIGIPCFIKSIRLLAKQDPIINERIKYFIGLVCGHLKSANFAKSIGWQLGINPTHLESIDFRKKLENKSANNYGVEVKGIKGNKIEILTSPTKDLYTTNWGQGMFKYNSCEFCDDVLAETADITVGDAWLPEYADDSRGTNIITVRNTDILNILQDSSDKIFLEEISINKVYSSQAGGFRHRREGLAYRLYLKDSNNEWRPQKRVVASDKINAKRKKIYEKRSELSQASFTAYEIAEKEGEFQTFIDYMNPMVKMYTKLATPTLLERATTKIKTKLVDKFENI
ncbi:Coenzyme F420 hydrogenase/dehydrogenase, beta subunit C-terminal domain [Planococcus chinensis]|uniref:Coenzyme F420 hydrogenase/dehydrogenase, beta subunit C-terminal domain n=1 Tax=Planococcus chinensis TaxID=272917 RepID=A0ABW4QER4_9BACL